MSLARMIVGIAFAAFCVWLTVRIVNRRERWAKWTLAVVVGMALYAGSWMPMARLTEWLNARGLLPEWASTVLAFFYLPLNMALLFWHWISGK